MRLLLVDNLFMVCDLSRDLVPPLALGWVISGYMFISETSRPRTLEHDPKPTTANRAPRTANRAPRSTPPSPQIGAMFIKPDRMYIKLSYTCPQIDEKRGAQCPRTILMALEYQLSNTKAHSYEGFSGVNAARTTPPHRLVDN